MRMLNGATFYTKDQWKRMIWNKARDLEKNDWSYQKFIFKSTMNKRIIGSNIISDMVAPIRL